jgi:hypothetical protein
MEKYIVKVVNVFSNLVEVEAVDENQAREKVKEILVNKEREVEFEHLYESTLPAEHWAVISKKDFDKIGEDYVAKKQSEQSNIITPEIEIITP